MLHISSHQSHHCSPFRPCPCPCTAPQGRGAGLFKLLHIQRGGGQLLEHGQGSSGKRFAICFGNFAILKTVRERKTDRCVSSCLGPNWGELGQIGCQKIVSLQYQVGELCPVKKCQNWHLESLEASAQEPVPQCPDTWRCSRSTLRRCVHATCGSAPSFC